MQKPTDLLIIKKSQAIISQMQLTVKRRRFLVYAIALSNSEAFN